jgi:hypothetical protein
VRAVDDTRAPEYQLKAEFLERFTRFIEWPGEEAVTGPFVIGVFGANPFGPYLTEMAAGRKIKGRSVEIREVSSPDDVGMCHILFIAGSQRKSLDRVLEKTSGRPILTVGDVAGFAEKGVLLNFYSAESNLRFEVNDAVARKSGLKFSSKLMKLARIVNLEEPK